MSDDKPLPIAYLIFTWVSMFLFGLAAWTALIVLTVKLVRFLFN